MEKEPTIENTVDMVITKAQITTATVIDRYFIYALIFPSL
jgi:hypothetical protein